MGTPWTAAASDPASPVRDASRDVSVEALIERAAEAGLHESRAWRALMHYRPRAFGSGVESIIDDPAFFLALGGKRDPLAEIAATIDGIMRTDIPLGDAHPQCRFPARLLYLSEALGLLPGDLPEARCSALGEYLEKVDPRSATLIFPEGYQNSPASMFGHTLLRIDTTRESALVSWAVNYSAHTGETFGPAFAVKGVFGLYDGYFSLMRYFEKLNDYGMIENRDIWEYSLGLSEGDVRRLALHVWELKDTGSEYYFFDENCSYRLLFLIEAARPDLDLTGGFFYWVTPVDSIRAAINAGLVTGHVWRPSLATRIRHVASVSAPAERKASLALAAGGMRADDVMAEQTFDREARVRVLDMASDYLKYRFSRHEMDRAAYAGRFRSVLAARSTLGTMEYEIPRPAKPPEDGHASSRASVVGGVQNHGEYAGVNLRLSYHDLLDPATGYAPGAAITFLETEARYYADSEDVALERMTFVDIVSLAWRDEFFHPTSWKVRFGLMREPDGRGGWRTPLSLVAGGGFAVGSDRGVAYAMLGPTARLGGALDHGHAAGAAASAGMLLAPAEWLRLQVEAEAAGFVIGQEHEAYQARTAASATLGRNLSARITATRSKVAEQHSSDASLYLNLYF